MIDIRPAGAQAASILAEIHGQGFEAPWSTQEIEALMEGLGAFALVATIQDVLAGFVLCRIAADEAEVLTIATRPSLRRRGVGAALLDAAIATAIARGAVALFLEVAVNNLAALALYGGRLPRRPAGSSQ